MSEDNVTIALRIIREHEPDVDLDYGCCELDGVGLEWRCKAKDCNWMPPYADSMPSWSQHILNTINDHLGL